MRAMVVVAICLLVVGCGPDIMPLDLGADLIQIHRPDLSTQEDMLPFCSDGDRLPVQCQLSDGGRIPGTLCELARECATPVTCKTLPPLAPITIRNYRSICSESICCVQLSSVADEGRTSEWIDCGDGWRCV